MDGEIGHLLVEYERLSVCHSHEKAINEQRLHLQKEIDNKMVGYIIKK